MEQIGCAEDRGFPEVRACQRGHMAEAVERTDAVWMTKAFQRTEAVQRSEEKPVYRRYCRLSWRWELSEEVGSSGG